MARGEKSSRRFQMPLSRGARVPTRSEQGRICGSERSYSPRCEPSKLYQSSRKIYCKLPLNLMGNGFCRYDIFFLFSKIHSASLKSSQSCRYSGGTRTQVFLILERRQTITDQTKRCEARLLMRTQNCQGTHQLLLGAKCARLLSDRPLDFT